MLEDLEYWSGGGYWEVGAWNRVDRYPGNRLSLESNRSWPSWGLVQ